MDSRGSFVALLLLLHIASQTAANSPNVIAQVDADVLSAILARLYLLEETMAKKYNTFESTLNQLVDERSFGVADKLRRDIVKAINQGDFTAAEENMLQMGDPKTVSGVVRDMASNSDHDFGLLINLARNMSNTSLKSQILTNLCYVSSDWKHISPQNLVALAKALSAEGITTLLDYLVEQMTSEQAINRFVSGVFGAIDSKVLLRSVSSHTDAWQALEGVDALIKKLKDSQEFNGTIVVDIASRLSEIMGRRNLSTAVQDKAVEVKKKIPGCLMNLFSLKPFCIRDKLKGTYFVTKPDDSDDSDDSESDIWHIRRWILTWDGEKMSLVNELGLLLNSQNEWLPEPYKDGFCFLKNLKLNKYVYVKENTVNDKTDYFRDYKDKPGNSEEQSSPFLVKIEKC